MGEKNAFSINNNFSTTVIQSLRGAVVKDQSSIIADSEGVSSNPDEAILLNFVHFFVFGFLIIFSFGLSSFILTADPTKLYEDFAITYF